MSGYNAPALDGLIASVADAALRFALMAASHPVLSFEFIAAASCLVLFRAGAQTA